jgi:putative heme iron utilization protein
MVAYAISRDGSELYLHLSELAPHTRNLQQNPRASLVISETDTGHGDPQQLARATLDGTVSELKPEASDYPSAQECYLSRLPDAQPLFSFGDFHLFRFRIEQLRFVGGFGQAYRFQPTELELA